MIIVNQPLNLQAIALEEAETKIRETVKNGFFGQKSKTAIDKEVFAIIAEALIKITIPKLRTAAQKSLVNFYLRQYYELRSSLASELPIFAAFMLLSGKTPTGASINPTEQEKSQAIQLLANSGYDTARLLGNPLQRYSAEYFDKNVKPVFMRLAKQNPLDPDDITGHNTLRNLAEMEVRYDRHMREIEELKAAGHKLVICSAHADCSERCSKYQGRVYSLDGTSGITDDGRNFVPLEYATQNPQDLYITKAGRVYQNGLFGFNCRHFLVPYQTGYRFPNPNPAEERRQYAITEEQRRLETQVRKWRTIAIYNKGQNLQAYNQARKKAIDYNDKYIAFSKKHNRAYFPSRTEIL